MDGEDSFPADLSELVRARDVGRRFLDTYGERGLMVAFERYGVLDALRRRGYTAPRCRVFVEADRHEVRVDDGDDHLAEVVVHRDRLRCDLQTAAPLVVDVLCIDWMLLQHPRAGFSKERPRLPGQEHPGLGMGARAISLLHRIVERLGLRAFVTTADHLHTAELYGRAMPYLDPFHAGRMRALLRTLRVEERLSLAQASWAVEWGLVYESDGSVLRYRGELQVGTNDAELNAVWASAPVRKMEAASFAASRFILDRAAFERRWADEAAALAGHPRSRE